MRCAEPGTVAPHASPLPYRPEVDGLRALAVLAVLLFHADVPLLAGGYLGVDIFFVISGFLITGILLREQERGVFSLARFYARRARRILPALAFVLLCCVPPALLLLDALQLRDFFAGLAAAGFGVSNLWFAGTTGYFDPAAESRVLLHTWSLGVEEQFYVVFPLLLVWLRPRGDRRAVLVLALLAAASLACAEWGWRHHAQANFFLAPGRAWELLVGSLAAFGVARRTALLRSLPRAAREGLAAGGLLAVIAALAMLDRSTPAPGLRLLLPVLGAAAVLVFAQRETWVGRLLALPPFVGIGLVSYSAYLWHQPLLAFARLYAVQPLPLSASLALVAASLPLAYLTWRFVEQPLRRLPTGGVRRTLSFGLATSLALASAGAVGHVTAPGMLPALPPGVVFAPPARAKECFDIPHAHDRREGWSCGVNPGAEAHPSFVLFGDSHALQLLDAFSEAARSARRSGVFAGFSGCPPLLDVVPLTRGSQEEFDCRALNARMLAYVKAQRPADVFLVARWSYYTDFDDANHYLNAIGRAPGEPATLDHTREVFADAVAKTAAAYAALGVRLHVIDQVPFQLAEPRSAYQRAWRHPGDAARVLDKLSVPRAAHERLQAFARAAWRADGVRGVALHDFDDLFCNARRCAIGTPEANWYSDTSHLSAHGARRLEPGIAALLAAR